MKLFKNIMFFLLFTTILTLISYNVLNLFNIPVNELAIGIIVLLSAWGSANMVDVINS